MSKRNPEPAGRTAARRAAYAAAVGLLAFVACQGRIGDGAESGLPGTPSAGAAHHPYDPSAPELMKPRPAGTAEWGAADMERELRARVEIEKGRRELDIPYYRIGYDIAYPLPLVKSPRMTDLPAGIAGIAYPWHTWLSWGLEERWRLFHLSWRRLGDREAGEMLQSELAALEGWDQYCELAGDASLSTAHLGACLAQALADREGWDPEKYERARAAAGKMIELESWPRVQREWPEGSEVTTGDLQNIRCIVLFRAAQLARIVESPRAEALESRAKNAFRAWCRHRLGTPALCEGTAYDGFLMDSLTEWLGGAADSRALLAEGRDALAGPASDWIRLALPGRVDVEAPLGDVEPEMPFWMTALSRLARWYRLSEAAWLVRRLPADGVPAAFLAETLEHGASLNGAAPPRAGAREHPQAISLRTGWEAGDILAATSLVRGEMGHLHNDAGHLVLGWRGRFWITDPGYQQYRPGVEREFSFGPEAHNVPVISGRAQTKRAPMPVSISEDPANGLRAVIDLSACYEGLPAGAIIQREIRLLPGAAPVVIVRDRLEGVGRDAEVRTSWQGGTGLAWAFKNGWARLSDGTHALWIGVHPGAIAAAALDRHEGSRGPLTLRDSAVMGEGTGDRYWVFACDPDGSWDPPVEKALALIRDWDKAGTAASASRRP